VYNTLMLVLIVNRAIDILQLLIIVDALLSWFPGARYRFREATRILEKITRPFMDPFRRLIPPSKTGGLDISPLLAIVALGIIRQIINSLLIGRGIWR